MTSFQTMNPTTGEPLQTYQEMSSDETKKIISATHNAYLQWRNTPIAEREKCVKKAADMLTKRKEEYAALITKEKGKTIIFPFF